MLSLARPPPSRQTKHLQDKKQRVSRTRPLQSKKKSKASKEEPLREASSLLIFIVVVKIFYALSTVKEKGGSKPTFSIQTVKLTCLTLRLCLSLFSSECGGFHIIINMLDEFGEIIDKHADQLGGLRVIGWLIGPGVARIEN